jgi:hypothetical protein
MLGWEYNCVWFWLYCTNSVTAIVRSERKESGSVLFPSNLPSDRLLLRVSYSPGWQVISPPPPWVTRRGAVWRGKASHSLQHGHVTPLPSYLGPGEGDGQQQQQQQYFNPLPSASPASSIPLLLPPYCTRCSVHVWRGA